MGAALRRACRALARGRGRQCCGARRRAALRRLGHALARGPRKAPAWRAVQGAAPAGPAPSGPGRDHRARGRHDAAPARRRVAAPRRLCPDRPWHRPHRRARPGELLHLVPQPGQGQLLQGAEGEGRRVQAQRVRGHPRRLPARRKDLRDEPGQSAGLQPRRAGHRRRRQPDLCGDRAPHLQRLHEGLHLSAPGAGRYPADRDPHPEGRAGAALGLRDLFASDPVEPARPAPPAAAAADREKGAGGRPRAGRLHPRPSSDQRRSFRRRDRRAQDRAAAGRNLRRRRRRQPPAVPADPRCGAPRRRARRPGHGRLWRGRRIRHHRALGQEFPEDRAPAARTPRPIRDVWRGALWRHDHDRRRLCAGFRPRGAVRRGRPADGDPDAEQSRPRGAPGLGFSDGVAADRGGQDRQHRQPDGAAAGRRDRRRADRDRHRDRVARLLPGAGREVPVALRDSGRRARRGGGERPVERGRARGGRRIHRPWPGDPRRARGRPPRRPRPASGRADRQLGRGDDRLSPAAH